MAPQGIVPRHPKRQVSAILPAFILLGYFLLPCAILAPAGSLGKVNVVLRPDAVEPPAPVDVKYSINDRVETRTGVQPGKGIDLGDVSVGTVVRFEVTNSGNAGAIRANILIDNCFRATGRCSSPGCVATAQYTAAIEKCVN